MPRFTVLRFGAPGGGRLMIEPVGANTAWPAGVRAVGEIQMPRSSRLVTLSPATLHVPGFGPVLLQDIVDGAQVVPGVIWEPLG